jgi:uncharacterized protein YjbJ (UPF0337 family)
MDRDHVERNWERLKAYVHREWEELTEDDLAEVEGNRERLITLIERRYGVPHEEARRQVEAWASHL